MLVLSLHVASALLMESACIFVASAVRPATEHIILIARVLEELFRLPFMVIVDAVAVDAAGAVAVAKAAGKESERMSSHTQC